MKRQGELIEILAKKARELRISKDPRPKKIEKLRAFLADSKNNLSSMPPLPLPLNARIEVTGIIPEKSSVFKSNMFPMLLYFQCSDGSEYPIIFKDGDDSVSNDVRWREHWGPSPVWERLESNSPPVGASP